MGMGVLTQSSKFEKLSMVRTSCKVGSKSPCSGEQSTLFPVLDLSKPDPKALVKACEEFGFFKVINHGVPMELVSRLESEAFQFFSLPSSEKELIAGPANPFGYGNRKIGRNGDVGWVEYLLMNSSSSSSSMSGIDHQKRSERLRSAAKEYLWEVQRMACEVLEIMAEGLRIQEKDVFSRLLRDEQSDTLFRLNHYPPCPDDDDDDDNHNDNDDDDDEQQQPLQVTRAGLVGFGEHTDPQIISVLRSNNTSGLEISLLDGNWVSVPPDHTSFFINVGDSLQVMTNGRFRSVRHRVIANTYKSRLSMIYFGGPPMGEKIAPIPSLMGVDQRSLYKEFTWREYKISAYKSRLADNRLELFQKIAA